MKNLRNAVMGLFLLSIPVGFGLMISLGVKDHRDTVVAMSKVLVAIDSLKTDSSLTVFDYTTARRAIISRNWEYSTDGAKKLLKKANIAFAESGDEIQVNL